MEQTAPRHAIRATIPENTATECSIADQPHAREWRISRRRKGGIAISPRLQAVAHLLAWQLVYVLLNIAGSDQRQEDLFSAESLLAKGRSALKGLKGVENVYMQHTPHLSQTLENLFKGRLRETTHPFLDGAGPNAGLQR